VVENQGNASAPANFWVDFYINPSQLPTEAGHLWSHPGFCGSPCYGLAWQVREALAAGQVITLTSSGPDSAHLIPDHTVWPGFFNSSGTQRVGAYVDSWNGTDPNGFIPESSETNNAMGLTNIGVSTAGTAGALKSGNVAPPAMPARPLPK